MDVEYIDQDNTNLTRLILNLEGLSKMAQRMIENKIKCIASFPVAGCSSATISRLGHAAVSF